MEIFDQISSTAVPVLDEFVRVWGQANSLKAVSRALGYPEHTCSNIAAALRVLGFDLKTMKRGRQLSQMTIRAYKANQDEFVEIWNMADSVKDVADYFKIPETQVMSRLKYYQEQGVLKENKP